MDTAAGASPSTPAWLTVHQAALLVGVSRRSIYNWIAAGKLETRRTAGGTQRILSTSLWQRTQAPGAPSDSV